MIKAIKHSWLTVIMLIVVCAAIFIGYTELFVQDEYESQYIIKSSLQYKTINKVATSHSTCKSIDDQTGQPPGTTKRSIKLSKDDSYLSILVTTDQAILSKKLADGVVEKIQSAYPNKITIIQSAVVNNNPIQKKLIKNTLKGCGFGLILGIVFVFITYFYNRHNA